jgi:hypothetical protein
MLILNIIKFLLQILRLMLMLRQHRLQKAKKNGAEALKEICTSLQSDFVLPLEWTGERGITNLEWEWAEREEVRGGMEIERGGVDEIYDEYGDEKKEGERYLLTDMER